MIRRCSHCGENALQLRSGIDGWSPFSIGTPLLQFECSSCGAQERDQFDRGAILASLLVGGGLAAMNLLDDGAVSFIGYTIEQNDQLLRDLQTDGFGGMVGFVLFFLFMASVFLLLPAMSLGYALRAVLWRIHHPITGTAPDTDEEWRSETPEEDRPTLPMKLRIGRAALLGLGLVLPFWVFAQAAISVDLLHLAGLVLLGGLVLLFRTEHRPWGTPLWLVLIFFFTFLIPGSILLEALFG